MKKRGILIIVSFIYGSLLNAQAIGIGSTVFTPDASAMLEVRATNKGLLIPQVALTGVNDATTISSPATSLLIYNTGTGGLSPAGYYYNAGTPAAPNWVKLQTTKEGWLLTGNAGTNPATNFLGTTDAQHLVFRTNNLERMRITSSGYVGIGTAAPNERLDVNGNIRFSGALMPNGNAGSAGAFLRSQGAGLPPIWSLPGLQVVSIYSLSSTGNRCINNTTFATYPGCSQTIALTAGQKVLAIAEAGILTDNNCDGSSDDGYVYVDARVAVNGNDFPDGAWLRTALDSHVGYMYFNSITVAGIYTCTANGNYTFEFQARKAGGNVNAISGGNNSSALQANMILIVYNP